MLKYWGSAGRQLINWKIMRSQVTVFISHQGQTQNLCHRWKTWKCKMIQCTINFCVCFISMCGRWVLDMPLPCIKCVLKQSTHHKVQQTPDSNKEKCRKIHHLCKNAQSHFHILSPPRCVIRRMRNGCPSACMEDLWISISYQSSPRSAKCRRWWTYCLMHPGGSWAGEQHFTWDKLQQ